MQSQYPNNSQITQRSNEATQLQISSQYVQIKCPYSKTKSSLFCVNQECPLSSAFTCLSEQCPCLKQHRKCLKGDLKFVYQEVQRKINSSSLVKEQIETMIDKMIDELSNFRDTLISEVQEKMKYSELNQVQRKFLTLIQNGNQTQEISMNGKQMSVLWTGITSKNKSDPNNSQILCKQLEKLSQSILTSINKARVQITTFMEKSAKSFSLLTNIFGHESFERKLLLQSSIIKTEEFAKRFIKFMPENMIKLDILFRAKQHNFSLAKFYQLFGAETNLIVITLTDKEKTFCGYTPFCFYSGKNQAVSDPQGKSFLFSLDQNEKLSLTRTDVAIYRYSSRTGINFGYGGLYICDSANTVKNNGIGVPDSAYYTNPKYGPNKESYLKLNGNQQRSCLLHNWQVWRAEFQE